MSLNVGKKISFDAKHISRVELKNFDTKSLYRMAQMKLVVTKMPFFPQILPHATSIHLWMLDPYFCKRTNRKRRAKKRRKSKYGIENGNKNKSKYAFPRLNQLILFIINQSKLQKNFILEKANSRNML